MSLTVTDLAAMRDYRTLFENISFSLTEGQLLLVEGPNGSGKTTLLKLISGLRRADAGTIQWSNFPIDAPDCRLNQQMAWLSHNNPLKEDLSALENLQMLGAIRPRNQISKIDALKTVGLGKAKHKPVKTFSAGMKRRLALASLLIADTPLWILDEPQAALDKEGISLFESLALAHLQNRGMIVMTSHHVVNLPEQHMIRLNLGA